MNQKVTSVKKSKRWIMTSIITILFLMISVAVVFMDARIGNVIGDDTPTIGEIWGGDSDVASTFAGGTGTASDPYLISKPNELALLAAIHSNTFSSEQQAEFLAEYGLTYIVVRENANSHYKLTNDIYLNDVKQASVWSDGLRPKNTWALPIGTNAAFGAIFDGDGYSVRGVFIHSTGGSQGLFRNVAATGVVQNLGVEQSYIRGSSSVGGVVAYNSGTISNCFFDGRVIGTSSYIGGIAGNSVAGAKIVASHNRGQITGVGRVGGVVGQIAHAIENCYNAGSVRSVGNVSAARYIGGIVGYLGDVGANVINCYNIGDVVGEYSDVGGISGYATYQKFTDCYNTGSVTGTTLVAGIAPSISYHTTHGSAIVDNCFNSGAITGSNQAAATVIGGLVANGVSASAYIRNSHNSGEVTIAAGGFGNAGGIAGTSAATLTNVYNSGRISAPAATGGAVQIAGIVAENTGSLTDVYNTGEINVISTTGINAGGNGATNHSTAATVTRAFNSGNITIESTGGNANAGGIIALNGSSTNFGRLDYLYNTGNITVKSATSSAQAGGLTGYNLGLMRWAYNEGDITAAGLHVYAGGISAQQATTNVAGANTSFFNSGNIKAIARAQTYIGGAFGNASVSVGYAHNTGNIDVEHLGETTHTVYVGGVIGYVTTNSNQLYNTGNITFKRSGDLSGLIGIGGVLGYSQVTITDSYNEGNIDVEMEGTLAQDISIGGVLGRSQGGNSILTRSVNKGDITVLSDCATTAVLYVGGITALYSSATGINSAQNSGDIDLTINGAVTGTNGINVGGISGRNTGAGSVASGTAINTGDITLNTGNNNTFVGGIFGYSAGVIAHAKNLGDITNNSTGTNSYTGGIAGQMTANIIYSTNEGDVTVGAAQNARAGGIVGHTTAATNYNINRGDVNVGASTGITDVGGIVGYSTSTVTRNINYATVVVESAGVTAYVAGIVGRNVGGSVSHANNYGEISYDGTDLTAVYLGGIVGQLNVIFTYLGNEGNVNYNGEAAEAFVGGVAGFYAQPSVTGNTTYQAYWYNRGNIEGGTYTGGIVGRLTYASAFIMNYHRGYNSGNISGDEYAGGIIGYATTGASANSRVVINYLYIKGSVSGASGKTGLFAGAVSGPGASDVTNSYYADGSNAETPFFGTSGMIAGAATNVHPYDMDGNILDGSGVNTLNSMFSGANYFSTTFVEGNPYPLMNFGIVAGATLNITESEFVYSMPFDKPVKVPERFPAVFPEWITPEPIVKGENNYPQTPSGSQVWAGGVATSFAEGSGDGTAESKAILIENGEQLKYLSSLLGAAGTYATHGALHYRLTKDIYLGDIARFNVSDAAAVGGVTQWTVPIGDTAARVFNGVFDGAGYTVYGMYYNNNTAVKALFGFNGGTIKNLDVKHSKIMGATNNLAGIAINNSGTIDNCSFSGVIYSTISNTHNNIGGIAAHNTGTIKNTTNNANVYSTYLARADYVYYARAGGIAGVNSGTIINCSNTGNISGGGYYVGGITGHSDAGSSISDCTNSGNITSRSSGGTNLVYGQYAGGIAGYYNSTIINLTNCHNMGSVTASSYNAGGIVGHLLGSASSIIDCSNKGNVSGTTNVGGIVGNLAGNSVAGQSNIKNCFNIGDISSTGTSGGIVGQSTATAMGDIINCYSIGNITSSGATNGGIAGNKLYGGIYNCTFTGNISGTSTMGGIVGNLGAVATPGVIEDCHASGSIVGNSTLIGGIAGRIYGDTYNCSHTGGNLTGAGQIGGVVGASNGNIISCFNDGDITATGAYAGGIMGDAITSTARKYIEDCHNSGKITSNSNYVGGIVGRASNNYDILGCFNIGNITNTSATAVSHVGGIVGYTTGVTGYPASTIKDCYNEGDIKCLLTSYVGGIAGHLGGFSVAITATVENCYNIGAIETTGDYLGGVVGYSTYAKILGSHNKGSVISRMNRQAAESANVGGIAGVLTNSSIADNCFNTASVTFDNSRNAVNAGYVGGVVGTASVNSIITNSYNTGAVTTDGLYAGGIVSNLSASTVKNAYNLGAILADDRAGGIAGNMSGVSLIENVYNGGQVSLSNSAGTFAGALIAIHSAGTLRNSYYFLGTVANDKQVGSGAGGTLNIAGANASGTLNAVSYGNMTKLWETLTVWVNDENAVNSGAYKAWTSDRVIPEFYEANGVWNVWDGEAHTPFADGDGSEQNPYLITTAEELAEIAYQVNKGGLSYNGVYFRMTQDIYLNHVNDWEQWSYSYRPNNDWSPIGSATAAFAGTFDGDGFAVHGMYIGSNQHYLGLFGHITGTVKNLGIKRSNISSTAGYNIGGIVGYSEGGVLSNVSFDGNVSGMNYVGGIVGYNTGTIDNANKTRNVTAVGEFVGGITGYSEGDITACSVNGRITSVGINVGGIVGKTVAVTISDCKVEGYVTGGNYTGGIVGQSVGNITGCVSMAVVTGGSYTGGIVGNSNGDLTDNTATHKVFGGNRVGGIAGNSVGNIKNNVNTGYVEATGNYAGGIVGDMGAGEISGNKNAGAVSGSNYTGGIAGRNLGILKNNENINNVSGKDRVGGIAGYSNSAIPNSVSGGKITGFMYVGGIVGELVGINSALNNVQNSGTIAGTDYVGGIVGKTDGQIKKVKNFGAVSGNKYVGGIGGEILGQISDCLNTGIIIGADEFTGGIAGYAHVGITNCSNTAAINGAKRTGGIAGKSVTTITTSYNTGAIKATGDYVGGISGEGAGRVVSSYSIGNVEGNQYIGGIYGFASGEIANCFNNGDITAKSDYVGGIAGYSTARIVNCYSTGLITNSGLYAGGILGFNDGGSVINAFYLTGTAAGAVNGADDFNDASLALKFDATGKLYDSFGTDIGSFFGQLNEYIEDTGESGMLIFVNTGLFVRNAMSAYFEAALMYDIVLDYNYGNHPLITQTVISGRLYSVPELKRDGYTFLGWDLDDDGSVDLVGHSAIAPVNNMFMKALWKANTYELIYDLSYIGGNTPPAVTVTFDEEAPVGFVVNRTGFTFLGWAENTSGVYNLVIDADGKYIAGKGIVDASGNWIYPDDLTLYAQWRADKIEIKFNLNGGGTTTQTMITLDFEDVVDDLISTTSRDGCNFLGWYTSATGGVMLFDADGVLQKGNAYVDSDGKWIYNGYVTLYAHWYAYSFEIEFDSKGGTAVSEIDVTIGTAPVFDIPVLAGYALVGWAYTDGDPSTLVTDDKGILLFNVPGYTEYGTWAHANDITLYAIWRYADYTLTLNAPNGTVTPAEFTVTYQTVVGTIHTATRTGYSFIGWFTEAEGGEKVFNENGAIIPEAHGLTNYEGKWIVTSGIALYAQWSPNTYKVTYNSNGGATYNTDASFVYDAAAGTLEVPKLTGYSFVGWMIDQTTLQLALTDSEGNVLPNVPAFTDAAGNWVRAVDNTAVYARWQAGTYTVTFDAAGGSTIQAPIVVSYNTLVAIITIAPATRSGFTLIGWFTEGGQMLYDANGQIRDEANYISGGKWIHDDNITLYARWQPGIFNLTFNAGIGYTTQTSVSVTAGLKPEQLSGTNTLNFYRFDGWYTETSGGVKLFDKDGKPVTDATNTYTDSDGKWIFANNLTLYARWIEKSHDLVLNYNYSGSPMAGTETVTYLSGGYLDVPARAGHTFKGWAFETSAVNFATNSSGLILANITNGTNTYTDASGRWIFDGGVILYAQWEANEYTLTLDAKGGSLTSGDYSASIIYGTLATAQNLEVPVRTGYTFGGWVLFGTSIKLTDATGKILVNVANGVDSYTNSSGTWIYEGNVTLEAVWTQNTHEITLNADGGSLEDSTTIIIGYGNTAQPLEVPVRKGFTFLGWDAAGAYVTTDNGSFIKGSAYVDAAGKWQYTTGNSLTFTAKWAANHYTVTLNANGGTLVSGIYTISMIYGNTASVLGLPIRQGYTFEGWAPGSATATAVTDLNGVLTAAAYINGGNWAFDDDVTMFAKWTVKNYNITLDENGGTLTSPNLIQMTYDAPVKNLGVPTRTGYAFEGWALSGTVITDTNGNITSTSYVTAGNWTYDGSITLVAKWAASECTLILNANGGTGVSGSIPIAYGDTVPQLGKPSRDGYTFSGWSISGVLITDANGNFTLNTAYVDASGKWAYNGIGSLTLVAEWEANKYEITFNPNYLGSLIETQEVTFGAPLGALRIPARIGYTFKGWAIDAAGLTLITDGNGNITSTNYLDSGVWAFDDDITLFAKWAVNSYIVTLETGGGTLISGNPVAMTYGAVAANLGVPTRIGYTFKGWATDLAGTTVITDLTGKITSTNFVDNDNWIYDGSITLYAKWTPIIYTINLDSNGGILSSGNTVDMVYGAIAQKITPPTRIGYTFGGWAYNSAVSAAITDGTGSFILNTVYVDASGNWVFDGTSITLVAKWTASECTIELDSNGGTVSSGSIPVAYGDTVSQLEKPVRTGYTFAGWEASGVVITDTNGNFIKGTDYVDADGKWVYNGSGTLTLIAKWTANKYNITLNENHSDGSTDIVVATFGASQSALAVPTRTGYTFKGWALENTGITVITDVNGRIINTNYVTIDGNWKYADHVTLYAKWTANNYTVTLNFNDGTTADGIVSMTFDDAANGLGVPVRTGYTFKGWALEAAGATVISNVSGQIIDNNYVNGNNWVFANNITFYAKWEANTYVVTLDANGGTLDSVNTVTMTFNVLAQRIVPPSKTGYGFAGWTIAQSVAITDTNGDFIKGNAYIDADGKWIYDGTITLVAKWTAIEYTLTLNPDGGTVVSGTVLIMYNETTTNLEVPNRLGYIFAGWQIGSVLVTDANGNFVLSTQYVDASGKWIFEGSSTLAFTAKWTAKPYDIEYIDNYAGGTTQTVQVTYGATQAALKIPVRAGYAFVGWAIDSNGTTVITNAAGNVINTAYVDGGIWVYAGNVVLYAKWTAESYVVTLDTNEGTLSSGNNTATMGFGLTAAQLEVPTRNGYNFAGWEYNGTAVTNASGEFISNTTFVDAGGNWIYNGTVTFKAKWIAKVYVVTLNGNGGELSTGNTVSMTYNATAQSIASPSRVNYVFLGWTTTLNGSTYIIDADGIFINRSYVNNSGNWIYDGSVTLFAKWQAAVASVESGGNTEYFSNFEDAWTAANYSAGSESTVKLLNNAIVSNELIVTAGKKITLDLYGNTLNRNLVSAQSSGYIIGVNGELIIVDTLGGGKLTGGKNTTNGGGVYVASGGKLTLNSGTISANTATSGGGVYVAGGGTFVMDGGLLTGNTSVHGGGVYVAGGGVFKLSGNTTISDNIGGVYLADGSVMQIKDNASVVNNGEINVFVSSNAELLIVDDYTGTIFYTTQSTPIYGGVGVSVAKTSGGATNSGNFNSDIVGYYADIDGSGNVYSKKDYVVTMEVVTGPDKTTGYVTGDSFDLTGMEIKLTYGSGHSSVVLITTVLGGSDWSVTYKSGKNYLLASEAGITISYYDSEQGQNVLCDYYGLVVEKATPDVIALYNDNNVLYVNGIPAISLSSATVTGIGSILGSISWDASTWKAGDNLGFTWTFTPNDIDNYNIVTETVYFSVLAAEITNVTVTGNQNPTEYSGNAYSSFNVVGTAVLGNTVKVEYSYKDSASDLEYFTSFSDLIAAAPAGYLKNAGTHTVYYRLSAENHNEKTGSFSIVIQHKKIVKPTAGSISFAYDGTIKQITATNFTGFDSSFMRIVTDDGVIQQKNVGEYIMYIELKDTQNYTWDGASIDTDRLSFQWSITKTAHNGNIVFNENNIDEDYTGSSYSATVSVNHVAGEKQTYTIYYSTNGIDYYSLDIQAAPSFANVGLYTVYYKIVTDNYQDISGTLTVKINLVEASLGSHSVVASEHTYDGGEYADSYVVVTAKDSSNNSISQTDITITYSLTKNGTYGSLSDLNLVNADTTTVFYKLQIKNYAEITGTLNIVILRREVTLGSITVADKIYDGNADLQTNGTLGGVLFGDNLNIVAMATGKNAGTQNVILTLSGADSSNYKLPSYNITVEISKVTLNLSGVTALNRDYDGTNVINFNKAAGGIVAAEDVQLWGTVANENSGDNKQVTLEIKGADKANYELPVSYNLTVNIAKRIVDISNLSAVARDYDGTTAVTLAGTPSNILVGSEIIIVAKADSKNAGIRGVTLTLSGSAESNYTLPTKSSWPVALQTVTINKAVLDISAVIAKNKVYDGNNQIVIEGAITALGLNPMNEGIYVSGISASINAQTGISVILSITGDENNNYMLPAGYSIKVNISKAPVTVVPDFGGDRNIKYEKGALPLISVDSSTVPGNISWDTYTWDAGELIAGWTFIPYDSDNYMVMTNTVTFNILAASDKISYNENHFTGNYDGNPHLAFVSGIVTVNNAAYTLTYSYNGKTQAAPFEFTDAGTYVVTFTITAEGHETINGALTIRINPIDPQYTLPVLDTIKYNGQPLSSIPLDSGWSWKDSSIVPVVGDNRLIVVYNPESANYNSIEREIVLTVQRGIAKEAGIIKDPVAEPKDFGSTLAGFPLSEGWKWEDENILPDYDNEGYWAYMEVDDVNYDFSGVDGYDAETHRVRRLVGVDVEVPSGKENLFFGLGLGMLVAVAGLSSAACIMLRKKGKRDRAEMEDYMRNKGNSASTGGGE